MTAKEVSERIVGFLMLGGIALIVYAGVSSNSKSEARRAALAAATDPGEIAFLTVETKTKPVVARFGSVLEIEYAMDVGWSGPSMVRAFHRDAAQLIPMLFERGTDFETVRLVVNIELTDIRGHASRKCVIRLEMYRSTNGTLNWKNVWSENLPRIADDYWVHPTILR